MLFDSFVCSNFNYFSLVWHFCSATLSQEIEKIPEPTLSLFYNDSHSSYNSLKRGTTYHGSDPFAQISNQSFGVFKILKSRLHANLFQERFTFC